MPDSDFTTFKDCIDKGSFKEAICIDAYRVYDSCAEESCSWYILRSYILISNSNLFVPQSLAL